MKCSSCGKSTPFAGFVCEHCGADKFTDQRRNVAPLAGILTFLGLAIPAVFSIENRGAMVGCISVGAVFGFVVYLVLPYLPSFNDKQDLQRKIACLGNLKGRTRKEITDAVGLPHSVSYVGDKVLLSWGVGGFQGVYQIALIFKDDVCEGVTHEFSA